MSGRLRRNSRHGGRLRRVHGRLARRDVARLRRVCLRAATRASADAARMCSGCVFSGDRCACASRKRVDAAVAVERPVAAAVPADDRKKRNVVAADGPSGFCRCMELGAVVGSCAAGGGVGASGGRSVTSAGRRRTGRQRLVVTE